VRWLVLLTVVAAGLAAPSGAGAHSLVRSGGGLVSYESADATSLNTLVVRQGGGRVEFRDDTVDGGMDPGTCTPGTVDGNGYITQTFCSLDGVRRIRIDLADREDRATVSVELPVTMLGGTGADDLTGGAGADEITGGEGNDRVAGGPGGDVLAGDQGADALDGGDGDDRVAARDGEIDTVSCGPGADTVDADGGDSVAADCENVTRTGTAPPVAADDGRPPQVGAGAATLQHVGRSRVVHVYATTSKAGSLAASGFLEAADLRLPILRIGPVRVAVPGGGAELAFRLKGRNWRAASNALRKHKKVVVRLGVVGTDLTGRSTSRAAPVIRLAGGGASVLARAAHPEPNDVDGDEVRNEVDNCPDVRNGSQLDTDRDGAGDACDGDDDGDGHPDASDNCRVTPNPDQKDDDGDGFGNLCPRVDDDGDGVVNTDDNCDLAANPDQSDLDGDDKGDVCDADRDGDRFDDPYDNCPTVYNLEPTDTDGDGYVNDQRDGDGDGIGTACDPDESVIGALPPGSADRVRPKLTVGASRSYRLAEHRAGLVVRLRCSEACAGRVQVSIGRRDAKRMKLGRVVARGSARLGGAGTTYAFVRFTKAARKAISRRGRVKATLTTAVADPSGNRRTATRRLDVRR
jgi:Thrombospondin type 3 repeat/RTX calcium-binding nonapeptide repeat (4 copies)